MERQPVGEVSGPVGAGAHPLGADVQPVVVQRRGIGDAEADLFAALDQDRGLAQFGQACSQHGAGEPAADDDHGEGGGGVVHGTSIVHDAAAGQTGIRFPG